MTAGENQYSDRQNGESVTAIVQPQGLAYYWGTWSGRLIVANAIVFLWMSWLSNSVVMPTSDVLLLFGAKDPVGLAQGQWWRLLAPTFVHIGILHFAFNTLGLYYIGYQLEAVLGGPWFIALYLISGTFGNIMSAVFAASVSAGASGALFGLLGCGFYLERLAARRTAELTGSKPRRGAYSGMVVVNLIFGLVIPGIDNAAHLGGLVSGIVVTWAMLNLRPNRLLSAARGRAWAAIVILTLVSGAGTCLALSKTYQLKHMVFAAQHESDEGRALHFWSQAIVLDPRNSSLRFERGRLLFLLGETRFGIDDLRIAAAAPEVAGKFQALVKELDDSNRQTEAWEVRRLMEHAGVPF